MTRWSRNNARRLTAAAKQSTGRGGVGSLGGHGRGWREELAQKTSSMWRMSRTASLDHQGPSGGEGPF